MAESSLAREHFEATSVKDSLKKLKDKTEGAELDSEITDGLAALKDALASAKSYADSNSGDPDKLAELTNPWKVWDKKGNGKNAEYHDAMGDDKKTQAKNQDQIWKLLRANETAKLMRQIWRQEMFEYIMNNHGSPAVVEKMLAAQKIAPTTFKNYIAPAERLGIHLDDEDKRLMQKGDGEGFDGKLETILSKDGRTATDMSINVGSGMIDIPLDMASDLRFRNYVVDSKNNRVYALMANGCEGNFVVINFTTEKASAPLPPTKVESTMLDEVPTSWQRNRDGNGARGWNGQWIDEDYNSEEIKPIKTKTIGNILHFSDEGYIIGKAGIGFYDDTTHTVKETPINGIGEITGIQTNGDPIYIIGKDGFAEMSKDTGTIILHTAIGMIRNPGDLGNTDKIILGKKGIAEWKDDKYEFTPINGIGEIMSMSFYDKDLGQMFQNIRGTEGVAYFDGKTQKWVPIKLGIGEVKYFGTSKIAISETNVAFIDVETGTSKKFVIPETDRSLVKKLWESADGRYLAHSKMENGEWTFSDGTDTHTITLDKAAYEKFEEALTQVQSEILQGTINLGDDKLEDSKKNIKNAEKILGEEPLKSTDDENSEKKEQLDALKELKEKHAAKETEMNSEALKTAIQGVEAKIKNGNDALAKPVTDIAGAKTALTQARALMTQEGPLKSAKKDVQDPLQKKIDELGTAIGAKEGEIMKAEKIVEALAEIDGLIAIGRAQKSLDTTAARATLDTAKGKINEGPLKEGPSDPSLHGQKEPTVKALQKLEADIVAEEEKKLQVYKINPDEQKVINLGLAEDAVTDFSDLFVMQSDGKTLNMIATQEQLKRVSFVSNLRDKITAADTTKSGNMETIAETIYSSLDNYPTPQKNTDSDYRKPDGFDAAIGSKKSAYEVMRYLKALPENPGRDFIFSFRNKFPLSEDNKLTKKIEARTDITIDKEKYVAILNKPRFTLKELIQARSESEDAETQGDKVIEAVRAHYEGTQN